MAVLAPLADPYTDPWLAPFACDGLSWWLLHGDEMAELGEVLADLLTRVDDRPDSAWVVFLRGSRARVRYVCGAIATDSRVTTRRREAHVAFGPVSSAEAIDALDRGETAVVSALLLLVDDAAVPATIGAFGRQGYAGAPERPRAVVMRHAGDGWAAVGLLADQPPPVAGVLTSQAAKPVPPAMPASKGRAAERLDGRGRLTVVLAIAVACLVGIGSWLTLRAQPNPTGDAARPSYVVPESAPSIAATMPEPGNQPALAFDPAHQDMVLFGGLEAAATTWLLARQGWSPGTTSASPSDRFGAAVAYDPQMGKVVLFGGREMAGEVVNDTWAWDGATWTPLASSEPGPPGREFSGMAWDAARRQMVLVTPPNVGFASGAAMTWTLGPHGWVRAASAANPPAEPSSALAFDPATGTVLLVLSGLSPGASPSTWSWDGTAWQERHPPHQPDLGGFTSFLAPIPGTRQLILMRLSVASPQILETWTWDGHDWTRQHPSVTPTELVGLIADQADGRVLAIGRVAGAPGLNAAWAWTGLEWTRRPLSVGSS